MKQRLTGLLAGLAWCVNVTAATDPIYVNLGSITVAPQIDATAFLNIGSFTPGLSAGSGILGAEDFVFFGSSQPFTTQSTLYYTNANSGRMGGNLGFDFKYFSPANYAPAAQFVNYGQIDVGTYLQVQATNIYSSGLLGAGPAGLIELRGKDVDVSRSAIRTGTPPGNLSGAQGTYDHDSGRYTNPSAVVDQYWSIGENGVLAGATQGAAALSLALLQMPNPNSPSHQVLVASGRTNRVFLPQSANPGWAAFANTNKITDSNFLVQVVFVRTNSAPTDTNFWTDVRFGSVDANRGPNADPMARAITVELNMWDIDVVTGFPFTNKLYFIDRSGSVTNYVLYTNAFFTNYNRPLPYELSYLPTSEWTGGRPGNARYTNSLITNPQFVTQTVTNQYLAYSALFGSDAVLNQTPGGSLFAGLFGFYNPFLVTTALTDPTNKPGRIEIDAERLNMTEARIRGEGLVTIRGKHFTGDAPRKLDSPLLSLDLGSTNGVLKLTGAVPDSVRRFGGTVYAWSGIWTNQLPVVTPNPDPMATEAITNLIDFGFHVLVFDHNVQTIRPVSVRDFTMRAEHHIELTDRISVSRSLVIDAESMSTSGQLLLSDQLPDLVGTNFLRMRNFTNSGTITVPGIINFGQDRPTPLESFFNNTRGNVSGSSVLVASDNLENRGNITATRGGMEFASLATKFDGGRIQSIGNVLIRANEIKSRRAIINAGTITTNPISRLPEYRYGKLILDAKSMLTDGGADATNRWAVTDGFQLLSKPDSGDLLGTTLSTVAAPFAHVLHTWAADDRGATAAGFSNNVALGFLRLDGGPFGSIMDFGGTGSRNAIYTDILELSNHATNLESGLNIQSNMTVYFAYANVPVEQLDGKLDGRLRWVRNYAGPNSTANYTLPDNRSITVNKGVLASTSIDSDGDGLPNSRDAFPFEGAKITDAKTSGSEVLLSWKAAAQTTYIVEYRPVAAPADWTVLGALHNSATNAVEVQYRDGLSSGSSQRYYRVNYNP